MAAAPVISVAADSAAEDPIWTDLVEWLARFPGGTGVEEKVRLIHNQGATRCPPRALSSRAGLGN